MPLAEMYLRVFLLGMPFMGLYNFLAAIFRSRGDTRTPLQVLAVTSVTNALLDLLFAGPLGWGIAGVAGATVLAQVMAAGMLLHVLRHTEGVIRLDFHKLHWQGQRIREIVKIGLPAGIQAMVFSLSNIVIQAAINSLGADTMAASSAAFTIEINVYCIVYSFSQAATTFVSQNYGAGKLFRCRRATWLCFGLGLTFMTTVSLLVLCFGENLLALFDSHPEVIALGMVRIWYVVVPASINGIVDIFSGALRGYGYSLQPALLALVGICGVRLAWVYLAFPASPDFATLMFCYPLSWTVTAVFIGVAYWFYTKHVKVLRLRVARN
jgi:putative MATE family efflux protein